LAVDSHADGRQRQDDDIERLVDGALGISIASTHVEPDERQLS
jgi:hypothetical protein